ncbi:aromatic amino acid DMT transporter YddG [bacterium]|nr:aromatic amino acid DMT transporter YddG [bacterium]
MRPCGLHSPQTGQAAPDPVVPVPAATLGGFGAILLWSTTVAVARSLTEALGPLTAGAAVFSVSGLLAVGLGGRRQATWRSILRQPIPYLAGCGLLFVAYMVLLFLAVGGARTRQQTLEIGLLNYLWPVMTVVLSIPLLGRKWGWLLPPGVIVALGGMVLVVTQGGPVSWFGFMTNFLTNPGAYGMALAAALCWALYSNLTHRFAPGAKEGAVRLFLPVTALVLLAAAWSVEEPRAWSWRAAAEAAFLGTATYLAYGLWDAAMRRGNVIKVGIASYSTPLISTLVSLAYLRVTPGLSLWFGCAALVLGAVMSWAGVSGGGGAKTRRP